MAHRGVGGLPQNDEGKGHSRIIRLPDAGEGDEWQNVVTRSTRRT